jgi:hypothetical protein
MSESSSKNGAGDDAADDNDAATEDDMRQHTEVEAEGPEAEEGSDVPRVHTQDPAEG